MARQRVHNRRAGRGSSGGGASWISYSDMMAALLLVFVLVLCYSLYQYFSMLETKTRELEEQQLILQSQQAELDSKTSALTIAQTDIQQKQAALNQLTADAEVMRASLTQQQQALDAQSAALTLKQGELDAANASLAAREQELAALQSQLAAQQSQLTEQQTALDAANATLTQQQAALADASRLLSAQQAALDKQTEKIDDMVGIRSQIIKELSAVLAQSNLRASVDPATGNIMLDSAVFFDTGKNTIKAEGKALLEQFIPVYLGVLLQEKYQEFLGEIIIEGHTDTKGTYLMNLELSQERALSVAKYCLQLPTLTSQQQSLLRNILVAQGKSFSRPVTNPDGTVNMDASRRVEFKFSLRDAEMIEEMNKILNMAP